MGQSIGEKVDATLADARDYLNTVIRWANGLVLTIAGALAAATAWLADFASLNPKYAALIMLVGGLLNLGQKKLVELLKRPATLPPG